MEIEQLKYMKAVQGRFGNWKEVERINKIIEMQELGMKQRREKECLKNS